MPNILHCIEILIARIKGFFYEGEHWVEKVPVVLNQSEDEWMKLPSYRGYSRYQHRAATRVFRSNGVVYDVYGYKFYETEMDVRFNDGVINRASIREVTHFPYAPQTVLLPYGGWRHFLLDLRAAWRIFWNLY